MNTKILSISAISLAFLFVAGCSKLSESLSPAIDTCANPVTHSERSRMEVDVKLQDTGNAFWSTVTKVRGRGDSLYSLQYNGECGKRTLRSALVGVSKSGARKEFAAPENETWIDFDISPSGDLVALSAKEVKVIDADLGFSTKELTVTVFSLGDIRRFAYTDSKRDRAVRYDAAGKPVKVTHHDPVKMLFATTSYLAGFARLVALDGSVIVSSFGTNGFKLIEFDLAGKELWQTDVAPVTPSNSVLVDTAAPLVAVVGGKIFTAMDLLSQDRDFYGIHFKKALPKGDGTREQALLQVFDKTSVVQALGAGAEIFSTHDLAGRVTTDHGIVIGIVGSSGGAGKREAAVRLWNGALEPLNDFQFKLEGETDASALVVENGGILVAGSYGFKQVETGSVVEAPDAFASYFDFTGRKLQQYLFGTKRAESIKSMIVGGDGRVYIGGSYDGPITHTADQDRSLGFSRALLGEVRFRQ